MSVATILLARLMESDDADRTVIAFIAVLVDPIVTGRHRSIFAEQCMALINLPGGGVQLGGEEDRCTRPAGHPGGCTARPRRSPATTVIDRSHLIPTRGEPR